MKRWNSAKGEYTEEPDVDAFLADVIAVCKKHGMSISHEDHHGGFVIERFDESTAEWLLQASDGRGA